MVKSNFLRRSEEPRHAPGVKGNDDQDVYRHAEHDVEHGHKQNRFLEKQSLHQDLQRQEQCQVNHSDSCQERLLQQTKIKNVVSQSKQKGNGRDQRYSSCN